jgi:hypothetical protein
MAPPARAAQLAPRRERLRIDGVRIAVVAAAAQLQSERLVAPRQPVEGRHQHVDALGTDHAAHERGDRHGVLRRRQGRKRDRVHAGPSQDRKPGARRRPLSAQDGEVVGVLDQQVGAWLAQQRGDGAHGPGAIEPHEGRFRHRQQAEARHVQDRVPRRHELEGDRTQHDRLHGDQVDDIRVLGLQNAREVPGGDGTL